VLDALSAGRRDQVNPAARLFEADLRDAGAVREIVGRERPETIYHLAAQMDVRRSVADPSFDASVNLVGFLNLIEAGRQSGLRRVIFSSTGGAIYGEQEVFPCAEDHPLRPVSPYGVAKLATEKYLFFYQVEYGLEYLALRYANVYGPRQDPHGEAGVVAIFFGRLTEGGTPLIFGDGSQTRDYVYVGDVVAANIAALAYAGSHPAFNIGTQTETNVVDLLAACQAAAGTAIVPEHRPMRLGELDRSCLDCSLAAAELGWRPSVSMAEGLSATLASLHP
jgi:UDP-glucose 4-epimerase